uniref:NADH dehydrogenase subunit 4L n=1 Tax=Cyphonia clavata TaxID=104817 RepID=UPI0022FDA045|nr:NADH dehydrogenase subunit 4L [Cyphonia clavata]WAP90804.1 NADH dehydrogenase subunit 4L [Cyphonia clavata]
MFFFYFFMFFGVMNLCFVRKHIFMCLISLEFIIIYLLLIIYFYCLSFFSSMYLYVLMMTFLVCEGALGLSLMIFLIRCHSNDYINSMMMW